MSARMKGLLKGLRHISHMFDAKEEHEMQIGYPTDVKHVAHIGWDGAALNSPSWMNAFRSASLASESAADPSSLLPLPGLHGLSSATAVDSPTRSPGARRNPRRRKQQQLNATAVAEDSPNREPSSRRRSAKRSDEATPTYSPRQDPPVISPATSRRKKSVARKGSSSRTAKSKFWAAASDGEDMAARGADDAAGARAN